MNNKYLIVAIVLGCLIAVLQADETEQGRIDRLKSLPTAEKEELARKLERYESLTDEERQKVHRLYQQIQANPKKEELLLVMQNYHEWLKTLTSRQLTELRQMTDDERLTRIKQLLLEQQQERQRQSWLKIAHRASSEDLDTVYQWMREFAEAHREQILSSLPGDFASRISEIDDPERQTIVLMYLSVVQRFYIRAEAGPSQSEIDDLISRLSPDAKKLFKDADGPRQLQLLSIWMRTAFWSKSFPDVTSVQLAEFYDRMPPDQRDRLDKMAPQERELELRTAYSMANFFRPGEMGRGGLGGPRTNQGAPDRRRSPAAK